MSVDKILTEWKTKQIKTIYWFEGEEEFYINKLVDYAEHHLLPESEKAFNLSVFYGKDADWNTIFNTSRRNPMFAEKQVVILKEAQQMRDIDRLEGYIQHPLSSTILVVSYKDKKVDGRSKLAKLLKEKGELYSTKKLYDNQLPEWTSELVQTKGKTIGQKALMLLVEHIGNDLNRLDSEIDKVLINLGDRKNITEDDIEQFVGVSKEYNVFELQNALARKDLSKAIRIIGYFESNPKAAPIQQILPTLYNFYSKTYMLFGQTGYDEKTAAASIGVNPFFIKDYLLAAKNYAYEGVETVLLLLHEYNLKSIGVNSINAEDGSLLKEMVVKMMLKPVA